MKFCVFPLSIESLFPTALLSLLNINLADLRLNSLESSWYRTPGLGSPVWGLEPSLFWGVVIILLFVGQPTRGFWVLTVQDSISLPNLWFRLCIFSCKWSFLVDSGLFLNHSYPGNSCNFHVPRRRDEFRVFILCHLGTPSIYLLLRLEACLKLSFSGPHHKPTETIYAAEAKESVF